MKRKSPVISPTPRQGAYGNRSRRAGEDVGRGRDRGCRGHRAGTQGQRWLRALVGLDRQAVNDAFAEFLGGGTVTREQIEFIGLVVDHLTAQGVMEPGLLYESPFTDVAPQGPEQVFDGVRTTRLFEVIEEINWSAVA
ncbi:type I restriction-modification enzyme R subunit C-terminal domain-containing protein [Methylobacterium thuringiense]|nr:type I restriction-modification enzyme R subunit C-terminal domain-containing protein [Methylobacterium thuringiense]